jgi:Tat protein secretion system quality control protein TatD with DNase activity
MLGDGGGVIPPLEDQPSWENWKVLDDLEDEEADTEEQPRQEEEDVVVKGFYVQPFAVQAVSHRELEKRRRVKRHGRACPVCGHKVFDHLKVHCLLQHFPWFVAPTTTCFKCCVQEGRQYFITVGHLDFMMTHPHGTEQTDENLIKWAHHMFGLLHYVRQNLCASLPTLYDLKQYVVQQHWWTPATPGHPEDFIEDDIHCMRIFEWCAATVPTHRFSIHPPNSVASLCHWRILAILISKLPSRCRAEVCEFNTSTTYTGTLVNTVDSPLFIRQDILKFIDSHFHLDKLCVKGSDMANFNLLEAKLGKTGYLLTNGIANCVFPDHWEAMEHLLDQEQGRIRYTFGVHPHLVRSIRWNWSDLERLIQHPQCIAVGEVGFDDTTQCKCRVPCTDNELCRRQTTSAQQRFLMKLLPRVKALGKPLVVHCRDGGTGMAAKAMLAVLEQNEMTDWPIHRHCFTGTGEELEEWMRRLPHCLFGFTSLIQYSSCELRRVIIRMPANRILLESDAPYLPPRRSSSADTNRILLESDALNLTPSRAGAPNTPWRTQFQANILAGIRGKPLSLILAQTSQNARQLYRL